MAPPAPFKNRAEYAWDAQNIADLLTPQTGAYYEIWLDGEKAISGEEDPHVKEARQQMEREPSSMTTRSDLWNLLYAPQFKCAVTVPGDNSVDIYSQDSSGTTNDQKRARGFNVFAGGGLGRTHQRRDVCTAG